MYTLKAVVDTKSPLVLPDFMYKLPNIHQDDDPSSQMPCTDVNFLRSLEDRQESLLNKLEQLKKEVEALTGNKSTTNVGASKGPTDIVINADPSQTPVALLVLQQLLSSQFKVLTTCHRHSSAGVVDQKQLELFGTGANGVTTNRRLYDIVFTLVWKDVRHGPSMMVNPRVQTAVEGEGNIARYLARLMQPPYDQSSDLVTISEIDQWVDSASQYQRGNNKEKASVIKAMNAKLGKAEWLVGNAMSLADVMLWGVLTQDGQGSTVSGNVKSWYEKCCNIKEFNSVLSRL